MDVLLRAQEATVKMYTRMIDREILGRQLGEKLILTGDLSEVTQFIPERLMEVIYIPIRLFTDKEDYYLTTKERILVGMGGIEEIGVMETIYKDLELAPLVYNIIIARVLKDTKKFEELLNRDTISEVVRQFKESAPEKEKV